MGPIKIEIAKANTTRRGFVKDLAAGTAGIAVAGALRASLTPSESGLIAAPKPVMQAAAKESDTGGISLPSSGRRNMKSDLER